MVARPPTVAGVRATVAGKDVAAHPDAVARYLTLAA